jgi:hypothetical protein
MTKGSSKQDLATWTAIDDWPEHAPVTEASPIGARAT